MRKVACRRGAELTELELYNNKKQSKFGEGYRVWSCERTFFTALVAVEILLSWVAPLIVHKHEFVAFAALGLMSKRMNEAAHERMPCRLTSTS